MGRKVVNYVGEMAITLQIIQQLKKLDGESAIRILKAALSFFHPEDVCQKHQESLNHGKTKGSELQ